MKKVIFFGLLISVFWSCSVDSAPSEEFHYEILPIRSVEMPGSVEYNQVYNINYTYLRPSTCHIYNDLYYVTDGVFRTVAVINTVINDNDTSSCETLNEVIEDNSFTFHVQNNAGTYIFKFWQGENEDGEDEYLIYEIPIE